jgi:hypothetical protein
MGGWMGGWVGGCKSRFKDCLQQSKTFCTVACFVTQAMAAKYKVRAIFELG